MVTGLPFGLDWETCDRARLARDPAFDGVFFTGVRTTRIYCRPVCPVRPAQSKNVQFFATVPHAGFGLGFERILAYVTGLANVRDAIPFPRTPGNARY
jgi:hypothetical protein